MMFAGRIISAAFFLLRTTRVLGGGLIGDVVESETTASTSPASQVLPIFNKSEPISTAVLMASSAYRRPKLEALLRPMYAVLPQSAPGELGERAFRYALHRLFVQRHGWDVRGLHAAVTTDGAAVHSYLQAVVAELGAVGRGLNVAELATVAAVIEELTHLEAVDKLLDTFTLHGFPVDGPLEEDYVGVFIALTMSHESAATVDAYMTASWNGEILADWETQKFFVWLLDVQFELAFAERHVRNPFVQKSWDLSFAVRVLEQLGEQHGHWQDLECRTLKAALVDLDTKSLGRVPLPDFYGAQLWGTVPPPFQFIETEDYLRQMGALDDSDPGRPGIIVPNYVNAYSNCVLSTDVYSVCCIDECESLLAKLEAAIGAPSASPREIAAVVANMPSDTVQAPRNLSASLLSRLDAIAALDDEGRVPMHSRLFAQWLHHAYPYECAYPHVSAEGMVMRQQTSDAWLDEERRLNGVMNATSDDIEHVYAQAAERHALTEGAEEGGATPRELMWTDEDVSFFEPASAQDKVQTAPQSGLGQLRARAVPAILLLASAAWSLKWAVAAAMRAMGLSSGAKSYEEDLIMKI